MKLTALYASVLALLFMGLSLRIIVLRTQLKVSIGDGGHERLQRAQRAHANCSEYVPFALLLIFLVESSGTSAWLVHSLASCLLLGRVIHAYGLSQLHERLVLRLIGMVLTITCIVGAALLLLLKYTFEVSLL
jgi:uncharacterized protein